MPPREAPDFPGPIEFDADALRTALARPGAGVPPAWSAPDAVRVVASTGSTSTDLVDLGRRAVHDRRAADVPRRRVLAALDQTSGRGRHGRQWLAGTGQITFSIGMTLELAPAVLGGLALVCGLATRDALDLLGADCRLKWPNDLVDAQGAKLGGLLVEVVSIASGGPVWVVLGIGINRKLDAGVRAQLAERGVTDLDAVGAVGLDPNRLVANLVERLEASLETFVHHGFAPFRDWFDRVHVYQDRMVRLGDGAASWEGRFAGVGPGGEARLVIDGTREIAQLSGELSLRPTPA
ncbi:hypothetical protein BH10PSE17_BH10PSE17_22550 [soil metagenome]